MSNVKTLTPEEFSVYKLVDPRCNFDIERRYFTSQGSENISVVGYQPMSATNTTLTYSVSTMGPNCILCKKAYILYTISLMDMNVNTALAPAAPSQVAISDTEGIHLLGLHAACNTLSVTINGQTNSWQPAEIISKMSLYNNQNIVMAESGYGVMYPQFCANSATGAGIINRNENAGYEQQFAPQNMMTNNVYNYAALVQEPTAGTNPIVNNFAVQWTAAEPIFCSPFETGYDTAGLYGVNKVSVQFDGLIASRFWASQMYDNVTVGPPATYAFRQMVPTPAQTPNGGPGKGLFVGTPMLYLMYMSVPKFLPIPPKVSYPIYEINMYKTSSASVTLSGTTGILTSNTIPIKCSPCRIYIFCAQSATSQQNVSNQNPYSPGLYSCGYNETCAAIQAINITYGNKTGLLSTADSYTLYQIARKNGFTGSFTQWSGASFAGTSATNGQFQSSNLVLVERPGIGGVLALTLEDLGVDSSSGCMETSQLIVQMTIYNQSVNVPTAGVDAGLRVSENHTYTMYVVIVNDGLLCVNTSDYTWSKTIAPISRIESAQAPIINNNSSWRYFKNMFGGSLGFPGSYQFFKKLFKG